MPQRDAAWHWWLHSVWRHAPCDGCRHERRCAAEELACRAFYLWVGTGRAQPERISRNPDRRWYERLFS